MNCQKGAKNLHLNFPRAQCDIFKLLLLSKQQPKTQRLLIYYHEDTEKQQIFTFKRLNYELFLLFYLKNDLLIIKIVVDSFSKDRLIDYLINHRSANIHMYTFTVCVLEAQHITNNTSLSIQILSCFSVMGQIVSVQMKTQKPGL